MNNLGAIGRLSQKYGVSDGAEHTKLRVSQGSRMHYTTTSPNNNLLGGLTYAASLQGSPQGTASLGYANTRIGELRRDINTTNAESRSIRPKEYWEAPVDKSTTAEFGRQAYTTTDSVRGKANCCQRYGGCLRTLLWILAALALIGGIILAYRIFFRPNPVQTVRPDEVQQNQDYRNVRSTTNQNQRIASQRSQGQPERVSQGGSLINSVKSNRLGSQTTQSSRSSQNRQSSQITQVSSQNRQVSNQNIAQSMTEQSQSSSQYVGNSGQDDTTSQTSRWSSVTTDHNTTQVAQCGNGFFRYRGQCIKCPIHSSWNGTNCILPQKVSEVYPRQRESPELTVRSIFYPQQETKFVGYSTTPLVKELLAPKTTVIRHDSQPR